MNPMISVPRAKQVRAEARTALSGNYARLFLLTLIALLFGAYHLLWPVLPPIAFRVAPISDVIREIYSLCATAVHHLGIHLPHHGEFFVRLNDWSTALWTIFACTWALQLFWSLVGHTARLGLLRCRVARIDGEQASASALFSGFGEFFWKALWLKILKALFIFLWSLLFIIPGIIAAYRYAMADYALCENPEMSARDALRESARMMKGNKWRLLCLRLSFLGWHILSLFTLGIGTVFLAPYTGQAEAVFYHHVSGRAAVRKMVEGLAEISEGL